MPVAIPLITLTTDFGEGSVYVAEMRGVILSINQSAHIVDLTHAVPPQDIRSGALALANASPRFPAGTLHIGVIDPGVGTEREILYAEIGVQRYICPDNGLLSRLAEEFGPPKLTAITNERWFRKPVSRTFHGRDVMAPVAAQLSLGLDPGKLGSPRTHFTKIEWPGAAKVAESGERGNVIEGVVESIDSFGNLITNITRPMLAGAPAGDSVSIVCDEHETHGIFQAYGDQPPMTLVALIGSSDRLELAIVDDSAKMMLGVAVGAPVVVKW